MYIISTLLTKNDLDSEIKIFQKVRYMGEMIHIFKTTVGIIISRRDYLKGSLQNQIIKQLRWENKFPLLTARAIVHMYKNETLF